MHLSTLSALPGKKITVHYGLVTGSTVETRHKGQHIAATIRTIFGGEVISYSILLEKAYNKALERLIRQAKQTEANAIIGIRFATTNVSLQAAELYIYGTAVRVEEDEDV